MRAHAARKPPARRRRRAYRAAHWRQGLNLALADVKVLAEVLDRAVSKNDRDALDKYTDRSLGRVWKAQHFSYWMTTMLHTLPDATDFDVLRQIGELTSIVSSRGGSTYLAERYTGWPS